MLVYYSGAFEGSLVANRTPRRFGYWTKAITTCDSADPPKYMGFLSVGSLGSSSGSVGSPGILGSCSRRLSNKVMRLAFHSNMLRDWILHG